MSVFAVSGNQPVPVRGFATSEDQRTAVVLRYLTFKKFISMLETQAVWFSRLGALQDKLEGTLPRKIYRWAKERDRRYAERLASNTELRARIQNMTERNTDSGRRMFAVNCWYLGAQESYEMWNEYGEEGKGVAIRSTVERLSMSFPKLAGRRLLSAIDRVQYVDFDNFEMDLNEAANADKVAFLKTNEKSHENEVRILTPNIHFNPDGMSIKCEQFDQKGLLLTCQLHTLIQAIIVGPQTDQHSTEQVEKLVASYKLGVNVEKSELPKQL